MKSYLRFLSRNKLYTAIMAVGLSVSMALVIIMSCYVWQSMKVNRHFPDQDRMYTISLDGTLMSNSSIAQVMEDSFAEIESSTVVIRSAFQVGEIDGHSLEYTPYTIVENDFFDMFPMDFVYGDEDVLDDMNNAIITRSLAEELGGEKLIGSKLSINGRLVLNIAAVIEDLDDTIFENDRIIANFSHPYFKDYNRNMYGGATGVNAIIKVRKGTDVEELLTKMEKVYESGIPQEYRSDNYLDLTCLDEIYKSDMNDGGHTGFKKGNPDLMYAFSIIVVFLLVSAVFNYINLSSALGGKRVKEMAGRMIHGESRNGIFVRNIKESAVFVTICTTAALLIAYACLPSVNRLIESPIVIKLGFCEGNVIFYLMVIMMTSVICGAVPALLATKFKPAEVFKGEYRYRNRRIFSKIFIVLQSTIAVIITAVTITFGCQIKHMMDMPLNADTEGLFICRTFSSGFENILRELPYIEEIGRADGRPGYSYGTLGFPDSENNNNMISLNIMRCDSTAFGLFGLKPVKSYNTTSPHGAWLTESTMKILRIDPENPVFPEQGVWALEDMEIAGIIEDIPFSSALNLDPDACGVVLVSPMESKEDYIVRLSDTSPENIRELIRICEEEQTRVNGHTFSHVKSGYYPDLCREGYDSMKKQFTMVSIFMVIAIMLSALGQIAMSTYYTHEREKETGIRKVFGATMKSESIRNIWKYMLYSLMACAIGIPVAVWIAERYLETFVYRMSLKPWIFIVATASMLAVSLLSVLWQTLRAARTNPAEALKKE